jgi:3-phosphoshikimate 1-carboxyvinyltransferase
VSDARVVAVPGDKSLSHRALIFAALANGRTNLSGVLDSADVRSTAECLRRLGVSIPPIATQMTIDGKGVAALRNPAFDLDCGNSGTSTRLLAGVVAGAGRTARFIGDASLSKRPMKRVAEPLQQMGARFEFESGDGLPMRIVGAQLKPIEWTSRSASAQVKGALLLAGLTARTSVTVHEPTLSRDHTERMLTALGVPLTVEGTSVTLLAGAPDMPGFEFDVPGDPSSAAFFAALALLTGKPVETSTISVNKTRTGFFSALTRMGAHITIKPEGDRCGEPVGRVMIGGGVTQPLALRERDVPSMIDELPLLACLAAYAPGDTVVSGAAELRVKESDRIATVVSNLTAIGARADERPDGFIVHGERKALRGRVTTHGDHRIAMAFGILGAVPGNEIEIDDPACADVSFPTFWTELARLSANA